MLYPSAFLQKVLIRNKKFDTTAADDNHDNTRENDVDGDMIPMFQISIASDSCADPEGLTGGPDPPPPLEKSQKYRVF